MTWVLGFIALAACGWVAFGFVRGLLNLGYLDAAIGTVRTLVTAERNFADSHPGLGYVCTLPELGKDELFMTLAQTGRWNEYAFELSGCNATTGIGPNRNYLITARPLLNHMPALCSDQSGIFKTDASGSIQHCITSGTPL